MGPSGYSSQGFDDEAAKHTTSFEAPIPEAGDPQTFPTCMGSQKEEHVKEPQGEDRKLQDGKPFTGTGFFAHSKQEAADISIIAEPKYTVEGFVGDKEEERQTERSRL